MELKFNKLSNLIDAFISDQQKNEYENIEEILIYCKNSANPIGRIVLELFNENNEKNIQICQTIYVQDFKFLISFKTLKMI